MPRVPIYAKERKFWRREKKLAKTLLVLSVIGLEMNLTSPEDSTVAFNIGYKIYRKATKKMKQKARPATYGQVEVFKMREDVLRNESLHFTMFRFSRSNIKHQVLLLVVWNFKLFRLGVGSEEELVHVDSPRFPSPSSSSCHTEWKGKEPQIDCLSSLSTSLPNTNAHSSLRQRSSSLSLSP